MQESVNEQRPEKIFADAKEVEITRAISKEFYDVLQDRAECDVIVIPNKKPRFQKEFI